MKRGAHAHSEPHICLHLYNYLNLLFMSAILFMLLNELAPLQRNVFCHQNIAHTEESYQIG